MIGRRYRLGGALAFALILLIQTPRPAATNGWEHGAVPFETLIEALSFESPAIREQAAHSLGFRGQAEAVKPLLDRLALPEPDGGVRQSIYEALGQLGAPEALPALSRCLTKERAAPIRAHCIEALGGLRSREALGIILAAFARTTDALVRDHAVDALGNFPHRRVVAALTDLLQADDETLRQRVLLALGRTGAEAAVAPVLNAFETAQSDDERFAALHALADLRSPAATGRPLRRPRAGREPATEGRDRGCAGGEPRRRGRGHVARLAGGSRSGRALYRGGRAAVPRHPERRPRLGGARAARGGDAGRPLCGRARRRPSQDRGCAEPADPRIARRRRPRACARDAGSARRCRAA